LRPTYVEIDLSKIAFNINEIKKKVAPAKIMAVVKANAYGHGIVPVSKLALQNGASYLAVALIEEAIELRESGFTEPILVFGGEFEHQINEIIDHNLEISIFSKKFVDYVSRQPSAKNSRIKVHIKIDTGMGRVGIPWQKATDFIRDVKQIKIFEIKGVYTHFASSDEHDKTYANRQLSRFKQVLEELERNDIHIPLRHAANSGAIVDLPEAYFDIVRPGIMMYGYYPSNETSQSVSIKPAMTFKSRVSYIKEVPSGTGISYGIKHITSSPTIIATIPVGYADGYNRLLSNKGQVIINGKKFPVVGRVCMDLIMVNIGTDNSIEIGDEVILFGKQGTMEFGVYEICNIVDTIPYEVCCWISKRVPRIYKW